MWYRWEPSGMWGDSIILTAADAASEDFARVSKYFATSPVGTETMKEAIADA